jgi:hypothetical protein
MVIRGASRDGFVLLAGVLFVSWEYLSGESVRRSGSNVGYVRVIACVNLWFKAVTVAALYSAS